MRAKTINEVIGFERGVSPKKTMGVGLEGLAEEYYNGYVTEKEIGELLSNDDLLIYLFGNVYNKWKNKPDIKPEDVEIWKDVTSGDTPIIKMSAPGVREKTIIRFEDYYQMVGPAIEDLLNSKEMKIKIANSLTEDLRDPDILIDMIYNPRTKKKVRFERWHDTKQVAERLINLLQ